MGKLSISDGVIICYAGLISIYFTSCRKFVQVQPPVTQMITSTVFSSNATATAAQLAIYTKMVSNSESWNMSQNSGLLADELTSHSTSATEKQLYTNGLISTNNSFGPWSNAYNYIYQANAIIAGLQNNNGITPVIAQQLTGESKFVRAFWFFYLTNLYGNIPLVTTTDYSVNNKIAQSSQPDVYAQIIKDLNDARQLLNANYVDASDTTVTSDRVRPTKWVAEALLARVYLYTGEFDSAVLAASAVINSGNFQLCTNLSPLMGPSSVFLKNSSEAIWQLDIPLPDTYNTQDAQSFVLTGAPGTATARSTTISPELLSTFETGDLRRSNWIGMVTKGGNSYYFPYKYQNTGSSVLEYIMVLRLAEQYLIRAEAEAQLNDLTDAAADLDTIRMRAGLGNISDSVASSQPSLLAAVLHERQVELFIEWGHRWFDLIRTNNIDGVLGGTGGVCRAKGGSWVSSDKLYPIPLTEIENDPNLIQNPGY